MAGKDPITYVLLVVDDSGSMFPVARDVRGGFNSYIKDLREDSEQNYKATLALFGNRYDLLVTDADVEDVPELTERNYRAHQGSTSLYDAIGRTLQEFGDRVKLRKKDRALLVVQTDGQDNSSEEFRKEDIAARISKLEDDEQWGCIFLGAGIDAWAVGGGMGFNQGSTISLAHTGQAAAASYSGLSGATRSYSRGASGEEAAEAVRKAVS